METKKQYPDWVLKQQIPGTTIRQVKDKYYLYSCTSKYVKGKKYPVGIQRYVGRITREGLIKPETISFIPLKDKLVLLSDEFDISNIDKTDKLLLEHICLFKQSSLYYIGKIDAKTFKVLNKYFLIEKGMLIERFK